MGLVKTIHLNEYKEELILRDEYANFLALQYEAIYYEPDEETDTDMAENSLDSDRSVVVLRVVK